MIFLRKDLMFNYEEIILEDFINKAKIFKMQTM